MKKIIFILVFSLICLGNFFVSSSHAENLKPFLNKQITLEGIAENAKLGAALRGVDFYVWIEDLDSWPQGYFQGEGNSKKLRVTGVLIEKYDLPVFVQDPNDPLMPQGMPVDEGTDLKQASHRYLLKDATWEVIE